MGVPTDGSPAFGVGPGHVLDDQGGEGDAEHGDDGDEDGAEVPSGEEVKAAERGGEEDLTGPAGEVARGGGVDEGGGHEQREDAGDGVELLDDVGGVFEGVFERASDADVVGRQGAADHDADDDHEDPDHHAAEPVAEFEAKDGEGEHGGYSTPLIFEKKTSSRSAWAGEKPSPGEVSAKTWMRGRPATSLLEMMR